MAEKPKLPFPLPPLPPFSKPPELKSIIDDAPAMIQSFVYGVKAIDQSIAAIDSAIKAMDALMMGTDALVSGAKVASEITSTDEAISVLKQAEQSLDPDLIEKAIKFFAKSESECPIAEYLSLALTHAKYGDKEKAKQLIRDVVEFVEGGGSCGE